MAPLHPVLPRRGVAPSQTLRMLMVVGCVGFVCIVRQMLTVAEDGAVQSQHLDPMAVRGSAGSRPAPERHAAVELTLGGGAVALAGAAAYDVDDLDALLENLVADFELAEETLQCSNYAGPMFLPYNPGGKIKRTTPIRAARLPDALERQPTLRPTRWPLAPFSLHAVRLLPGSRFAAAEATNLAFLRLLDPDRRRHYTHARSSGAHLHMRHAHTLGYAAT